MQLAVGDSKWVRSVWSFSEKQLRYQLHSVLMLVAFGVLVPVAVLVARYYRKSDHWFVVHKYLQTTAVCLSTVGFLLMYCHDPNIFNRPHGKLGVYFQQFSTTFWTILHFSQIFAFPTHEEVALNISTNTTR